MSKFRVNASINHLPSFKEYRIPGEELASHYKALDIALPFARSDSWYYYTDVKGWAKILPDLVVKSNLYRKDRTDCDWYARKAFVVCCERYGLNTLLYTYGSMPLGAHGWNTFWVGDHFMQFEPNEGFEDERGEYHDIWGVLDGDIVFDIGKNGYQPKQVLI